MILEQRSSQEEISQGTFILFLYLLLKCPPVPGRQKPGQVVCWVSDNKSILCLLSFLLGYFSLMGSRQTRMGRKCLLADPKSSLCGTIPSTLSNLPSISRLQDVQGFGMWSPQDYGRVWGRGSPSSSPDWCHCSWFWEQAVQWVYRKPQQVRMGIIWAQPSLWLCTLSQRGPALIYGMCNHTKTSF